MPAASYALFPNLKKRPIFCHRRGIDNFCRLFSTQQRPNVFVSDAWPAPATYHRSFSEQCDQRVGRSPKRARPAQISWRSRWFCRSMSVKGLGISPLRIKHFAEFFSSRSWPNIRPGMIFFVYFSKFVFFAKIRAHSERY